MTVRRSKTYSGSQGYVYQYYFAAKRPVPNTDATEYIFDVTSDLKTTYAVSVLLPLAAVTAWTAAHGRSLTDSEQYAAVKMRLFRAFDELKNMQNSGRRLEVDFPFLETSLATLGVD